MRGNQDKPCPEPDQKCRILNGILYHFVRIAGGCRKNAQVVAETHHIHAGNFSPEPICVTIILSNPEPIIPIMFITPGVKFKILLTHNGHKDYE